MIVRYRNRALKQLGISFGLLVLAGLAIGLRSLGFHQAFVALVVTVLALWALVLYLRGNISLAKAKGYDSAVVGAVIIVAGLCLSGLFFAMPLILFFGLKDKHGKRPHWAKPSPPMNPRATLPPLRHDGT